MKAHKINRRLLTGNKGTPAPKKKKITYWVNTRESVPGRDPEDTIVPYRYLHLWNTFALLPKEVYIFRWFTEVYHDLVERFSFSPYRIPDRYIYPSKRKLDQPPAGAKQKWKEKYGEGMEEAWKKYRSQFLKLGAATKPIHQYMEICIPWYFSALDEVSPVQPSQPPVRRPMDDTLRQLYAAASDYFDPTVLGL